MSIRPTSDLAFIRKALYLLSVMKNETGTENKPDWLKDYTYVAILGVIYILLFLLFTTTFNLP